MPGRWCSAAVWATSSTASLNGVVVDYINVLFMHFAIFNFADICVCVGVGLLMLVVLLDSCKKEKPRESEKADDDGAA